MTKATAKSKRSAAAQAAADARDWCKTAPGPTPSRKCTTCADERVRAFVHEALAAKAAGRIHTPITGIHAEIVARYGYKGGITTLQGHIRAHESALAGGSA